MGKLGLFLLFLVCIGHGQMAFAHNGDKPQVLFERYAPKIAHLPYERVYAMYFHESGALLEQRTVTQFLPSEVYFIPMSLLLNRVPDGAAELWVIHNHPSGNYRLSRADRDWGAYWAYWARRRGIGFSLMSLTNESYEYESLWEKESSVGLRGRMGEFGTYVIHPAWKTIYYRLAGYLRGLIGRSLSGGGEWKTPR